MIMIRNSERETVMQDWIGDDITFCLKDCDIDCERNQKNIRHRECPHSYSDFSGSDYCPIQREKKDAGRNE